MHGDLPTFGEYDLPPPESRGSLKRLFARFALNSGAATSSHIESKSETLDTLPDRELAEAVRYAIAKFELMHESIRDALPLPKFLPLTEGQWRFADSIDGLRVARSYLANNSAAFDLLVRAIPQLENSHDTGAMRMFIKKVMAIEASLCASFPERDQ